VFSRYLLEAPAVKRCPASFGHNRWRERKKLTEPRVSSDTFAGQRPDPDSGGRRNEGVIVLLALRRVPECVPGVSKDRRPCLWVGIFRPLLDLDSHVCRLRNPGICPFASTLVVELVEDLSCENRYPPILLKLRERWSEGNTITPDPLCWRSSRSSSGFRDAHAFQFHNLTFRCLRFYKDRDGGLASSKSFR